MAVMTAHLDALKHTAQLPDQLQERIDGGDLFCWDANDALDFQGQLQAYGAVKAKSDFPGATAGLMLCAMTCWLGCWR
jgi:hypothetical protein